MRESSTSRRLLFVVSVPSKSKPSLLVKDITTTSTAAAASDEQHPLQTQVLSSTQRGHGDPCDLKRERQVHARSIITGVGNVGTLKDRILGTYALLGSTRTSKNRSDDLPYPWNWMIRRLVLMGRSELALLLYLKMWDCDVSPDKYTFPLVIKACSALGAVRMGRAVHETIRRLGLEADLFICSSLIRMYVGGGSILDAREVFDRNPERDSILWNVMIDGYVRNNYMEEAVELFQGMRHSSCEVNDVSFVSVLSICASRGFLSYGLQLHGLAIRFGVDYEVPVANTLLAMYSKCQCWSHMNKLRSLMGGVGVVAWNGMISGYVQNGLFDEALDCFHEMQSVGMRPDSVTLTSLIPALVQGKEIQAYVLRNNLNVDVFLKSALIDLHFKCREVEMARHVFYGSDTIDVVVCSAMISGYVTNNMNFDALDVFHLLMRKGLRPNPVTIASLLPACSSLVALRLGMELHGFALKNAFIEKCYVGSAVLDMYAKCGRLDLAFRIFDRMPERDSVAWNCMISSFVQNAEPGEAIDLFRLMGLEDVVRDCVSVSCVLSACANLPALHYGKQVHGFMIRSSLGPDSFVDCALMDMYAKCGLLLCSRHVFDNIKTKNQVAWNSIIAAYGIHGHVMDAGILFDCMKETGHCPDYVTFLSMISACGHAGRVEEGLQYFKSMSEEYGILPRTEHYASVVDLYGRAGRLDDALCFIKEMPMQPDTSIWGALLGACRVHRNSEIAELATKHLFELDRWNSGYYVLMSHVQAVTGRWKGVQKIRNLMKERGVQKQPGCSWVNVNSSDHMFIASDRSHPQTANIYLFMDLLLFELKEEGYVPLPEVTSPLPSYAT